MKIIGDLLGCSMILTFFLCFIALAVQDNKKHNWKVGIALSCSALLMIILFIIWAFLL